MVFYPTKFKLEVSPLRRHPCFLLFSCFLIFHRLLPVLTEQNSTKVFHMLGGEADFKMHVQNLGPVYFRYCCNLRLCHHSLTVVNEHESTKLCQMAGAIGVRKCCKILRVLPKNLR